jgi:LysM repeat protein
MNRFTVFAGVGLVLGATALGLASCGGDAATSSSTPITISATNYVTIPPAPSTAAVVTTAPDTPGAILQYESTYVIQANDYPSTVASKFKVKFEDLMTLNGWTLDDSGIVPEWPGVGATIKIPAGATVPGLTPPTLTTLTPDPATATLPALTVAPTTTIGVCAKGTYVIQAGDLPGKVAANFNVSLDALNAANVNTKGYDAFIVGVTIVIPGKEGEC